MLTTLILLAAVGAPGDGVSVKFVPSGATAKAGGYRPLRAEMSEKSDAVKVAPEGLSSPRYGSIKLRDKSWGFILDEPAEKPARLFIDGNADGDYTNDSETKWTGNTANKLTMYQGESLVHLDWIWPCARGHAFRVFRVRR